MDTCSVCVRVRAEATHQHRRVGVCWILMRCLGKRHCPHYLLFNLFPSQACGLLSCEHTATIKDPFISFWTFFPLFFGCYCEKSSFTEAPQSNSPLIPIYQLLPNWI